MSTTPTSERLITVNASDPTETEQDREAFRNEVEDRWADVEAKVESYFHDENESIDYSRLRLNFIDYFEDAVRQNVLESTSNSNIRRGQHWTATYIRTAYQQGLTLARGDLNTVGFGSYQIKRATKNRRAEHEQQRVKQFEAAYATFREHVSRVVDTVSQTLREHIDQRSSSTEIVEDILDDVNSVVQSGRAHANSVVVGTVNEALLTTFEIIGVDAVGVVPESVGSANTVNGVQFRYNAPDISDIDSDDPRSPDEVTWVTAGDSKVCQACQALEGTTLEIDKVRKEEQFQPPIHPNCRCRLVPLMSDGGEPDSLNVERDEFDSIDDDTVDRGDVVTADGDSGPVVSVDDDSFVIDTSDGRKRVDFGTSGSRERYSVDGYADSVGHRLGGYNERQRRQIAEHLADHEETLSDKLNEIRFIHPDGKDDALGQYIGSDTIYLRSSRTHGGGAFLDGDYDTVQDEIDDLADEDLAVARDTGDMFEHEIGHLYHEREFEDNSRSFDLSMQLNAPDISDDEFVDMVSEYGNRHAWEGVPEIYAMKRRGDDIPERLQEWYEAFNGPEVNV